MDGLHHNKLALDKLDGLVTNLKWSPTDVTQLKESLILRFETAADDRPQLWTWMLNMLHSIEINFITPDWTCSTGQTLIQLLQDRTVTDERLREYLAGEKEKQLDEILEEIRQEKLNQIDEELLGKVRDIVSSVVEDLTEGNDGSQRTGLKKDLLKICQAVEEAHFRPRLTQMVSWCIMALSETGQLVQVSTGEGKSCIVAMFAAFRAMKGDKVDIMSSSSVLAERDMEEWKLFFKSLNISVSCNTKNNTSCYKNQVVYGTVIRFAGDWLRHHFQRQDIFGERKFQCAIVDEVDSMMLDKGNHVVYLSSDMPALQHLNPLLAFIWATVSQYRKPGKFCQYMFPDRNSRLKATEAQILHGLHFTPCDLNQQQHGCYVPGFLSDLVKSKLKVWIENAFLAQIMEKGHEYVIEKHGVVPVDYSCTGVIENSMKWSDGLQQFLEMKHELKLSDMTVITNYMSNVGLFQKYGTQIFGISGTLGQQAETETLQKIYGIQTCRIPTFKRRKLFEVQGVIADNEEEWKKKICQTVIEQTTSTPYRGPRAVLVICETINRANLIHNALAVQVQRKKLYTSNNMDNSEVFQKLQGGDVIVATNLAGRGTDLKVSDQVKEAGGLFVLQTFLPKNARVEAQAFGRTARQGSPGSAQLIVCSSHLPEPLQRDFIKKRENHLEDSEVKLVKKIRDDSVKKKVWRYLQKDLTRLKNKEELFSQYLGLLDDMHESSDNKPPLLFNVVKKMLLFYGLDQLDNAYKTIHKPAPSDLSALHEFWGMWLLTEFNHTDSISDLKTKLDKDLTVARQKIRQKESPSSNLHHYAVFGNDLNTKGQLAESINNYTKAIEADPCWAAFAYYNRAFANLARQKNQGRSCIQQALEDLQNSFKSVEFYCEQIEVTVRFFEQTRAPCHDLVTRFADHITKRKKLLECLKKNIDKAIETLKLAKDRGDAVKLNKQTVFCLVSLVDFLPMATSVFKSMHHILRRDLLKMQELMSDSSFDISIELRCLKSLGLTDIYTLDQLTFRHIPKSGIGRVVQWFSGWMSRKCQQTFK